MAGFYMLFISNSIDPTVSEILILIREFQNVPSTLGFEVKHSKFFRRNFRTCIIILSMDFMIIKLHRSACKKLHGFL